MVVDQKAKLRKKCQKNSKDNTCCGTFNAFKIFQGVFGHLETSRPYGIQADQPFTSGCTSMQQIWFWGSIWPPWLATSQSGGQHLRLKITHRISNVLNSSNFINKWWQLAPECHDIWIWMTLLWLSNMMNVTFDSCIHQSACQVIPGHGHELYTGHEAQEMDLSYLPK